jgi:hypothetical protein
MRLAWVIRARLRRLLRLREVALRHRRDLLRRRGPLLVDLELFLHSLRVHLESGLADAVH